LSRRKIYHFRNVKWKYRRYHNFCNDLVKKIDYEHWYSSMFMPGNARKGAMAIRAFNIELANIKNLVSNEQVGMIRLQWWKDVINNLFEGKIVENPVIMALGDTLDEFKLTKTWFLRIINARQKDISVRQPFSLKEIEDYAEQTSSSLLYLNLELLNINRDPNSDHAASHLGIATGLVILLKALPYHLKAKQLYLPMELTTKHSISQESLFRGEFSDKLKDVVYDIANTARSHLDLSRELQPKLKKPAHVALLSAGFMSDFLSRLEKNDFNPIDPNLLNKTVSARVQVTKNYYFSSY